MRARLCNGLLYERRPRRPRRSRGGPERGGQFAEADVRAGDEADRAHRQRDRVHAQAPRGRAVEVAAVHAVQVVTAGDGGQVAQRRENQRQEGAGHGSQHRYEQAQVRYQGGRDDCNTQHVNRIYWKRVTHAAAVP